MDGDGIGAIVGIIAVLAVIALIVYVVVLIAGVLAATAGACGTLWGGGTALVNYIKSFKENTIDSNRAAA